MPSVIITIRAGTGWLSVAPSVLEKFWMVCNAEMIASPVAVRSSSFSPEMASSTGCRSVVGETSTVAMPAKEISPRLTPGVSSLTNSLAASLAAVSRSGATSVDSMDSETSMASMTVARLRGTFVLAVGPASATTSSNSAAVITANGTCRTRLGRFGATFSRSSRLANRSVCFLVRRWTTT